MHYVSLCCLCDRAGPILGICLVLFIYVDPPNPLWAFARLLHAHADGNLRVYIHLPDIIFPLGGLFSPNLGSMTSPLHRPMLVSNHQRHEFVLFLEQPGPNPPHPICTNAPIVSNPAVSACFCLLKPLHVALQGSSGYVCAWVVHILAFKCYMFVIPSACVDQCFCNALWICQISRWLLHEFWTFGNRRSHAGDSIDAN